MRVLVLGGSGMLGHKLVQCWRQHFDVWTTLRTNFEEFERFNLFDKSKTIEFVDAENLDSVVKAFGIARPAVVVNCIGVIKQVEAVKNPVQTLLINSIFPHRLADLCRAAQVRLITLGTDCVFSGTKGNYSEIDQPDALDLYGRSKNLGETVTQDDCLTVRTSIIGRELKSAHSLLEWFLKNQNTVVKGFSNAIFSGFPTVVLADVLREIIENHRQLSGLWHISSEPISKYDLLCLVRDAYGLKTEITPFADFYCDRSLNSNRFRAETKIKIDSWQQMIEKMVADSTVYDKWRGLNKNVNF